MDCEDDDCWLMILGQKAKTQSPYTYFFLSLLVRQLKKRFSLEAFANERIINDVPLFFRVVFMFQTPLATLREVLSVLGSYYILCASIRVDSHSVIAGYSFEKVQ